MWTPVESIVSASALHSLLLMASQAASKCVEVRENKPTLSQTVSAVVIRRLLSEKIFMEIEKTTAHIQGKPKM